MMGGFHAFEGDSPHHVLLLPEVMELVRDGTLVAPLDDDIWALSKAGIFSKACALFQTLWFVVQCLARALQHLPLAQLEVATLAYTTMTVSMYLFWWNKPLRIDRPFRVQWHDKGEFATHRIYIMPLRKQDSCIHFRTVSRHLREYDPRLINVICTGLALPDSGPANESSLPPGSPAPISLHSRSCSFLTHSFGGSFHHCR